MTFLYEQTIQAFTNLKAFKLRSSLATLGILIGTAAIVALISCSLLATDKALSQFRSLSTNLIAINVFLDNRNHHAGINQIKLAAWRELPAMAPDVGQIAPYVVTYQSVSFAGHSLPATIIGADQNLQKIIHIDLEKGHFVSFVESFEQVCVIGHGLAKKLHRLTVDEYLGKQLRIGKNVYTIIGIAKHWHENSFFNDDINQAVIVPVAGMALIHQDAKINNAIALLKSTANLDVTINQIKNFLHQKAPQLGSYVRSAKQLIASMASEGHIFNLLLGVIGSIAIVVGGIGVMNVMLVSVSERKKEIGIRKAIGARNQDIQTLFLVESMLLSVFGGLSGCVLGIFLTWIIAWFSHWPFKLYLIPCAAAFTVSLLTGMCFGFYPAYRAARLQPIEALRIE